MAEAIVKIQERTAALASLGTTDLEDPEKMAALIRTAKEVNDQSKELKAQDTLVKDEFKRMCKPYTDAGKNVTCYDFDTEMKMTVTLTGGSIELDEDALLRGIYDFYGEEYGSKDGKAWEAYCEISDPVEVPRKINQDKLASRIKQAERIAAGQEEGRVYVTADLVSQATKEKAPSIAAKCSKMNKDEISRHKQGDLTDVMVVG